MGTTRKLAAVTAAAAVALSAPGISAADHGQRHGPKPPCPAKSKSGKKLAKGHLKKAKKISGKGRKCGHRTAA
ncbi:MAG: hypothetical protein M3N16_06130 [Actinomycetota bacterium]|nr:hypothetical protein [Actinomycetota bacterium]